MNSNYSEFIETAEAKKPGMLWYNFTAYLMMPLHSFFAVVTSVLLVPNVMQKLISLIPAEEYSPYWSFRFLNSDSVKILNIIFAFVMVALAFYRIYVSIALIKYKKSAPKHVNICLAASEIIGLIYFLMIILLLRDMFEFNAETIILLVRNVISTIIAVALWLLIYTRYFAKRKYLFVN